MQTVTIGVGPGWFLRSWGSNGLVHTSDRWEAWILRFAEWERALTEFIAAPAGVRPVSSSRP